MKRIKKLLLAAVVALFCAGSLCAGGRLSQAIEEHGLTGADRDFGNLNLKLLEFLQGLATEKNPDQRAYLSNRTTKLLEFLEAIAHETYGDHLEVDETTQSVRQGMLRIETAHTQKAYTVHAVVVNEMREELLKLIRKIPEARKLVDKADDGKYAEKGITTPNDRNMLQVLKSIRVLALYYNHFKLLEINSLKFEIGKKLTEKLEKAGKSVKAAELTPELKTQVTNLLNRFKPDELDGHEDATAYIAETRVEAERFVAALADREPVDRGNADTSNSTDPSLYQQHKTAFWIAGGVTLGGLAAYFYYRWKKGKKMPINEVEKQFAKRRKELLGR